MERIVSPTLFSNTFTFKGGETVEKKTHTKTDTEIQIVYDRDTAEVSDPSF